MVLKQENNSIMFIKEIRVTHHKSKLIGLAVVLVTIAFNDQ